MVEWREIRFWSDSRSGADKRRDDDRRNATTVDVEVEAVCHFGGEVFDRRDVWTRRNCLLRNGRRNNVIVHASVFVIRDDQERRLPVVTAAKSIIELLKKSLAVSHINGWIVFR